MTFFANVKSPARACPAGACFFARRRGLSPVWQVPTEKTTLTARLVFSQHTLLIDHHG